ncbi:hypothetical protein GbCGDNIH3_7209 [Granulibacter bethesdensis]|uniref:Uncharacterized protein n=1 Tax=Granulibacter bethesdensis TaxID=364410 RepID=A0AAN0RBM2_9PROT|nr:hypothetical protein GbCGDNIH3_7209 [Granulibacter bethesdensis]
MLLSQTQDDVPFWTAPKSKGRPEWRPLLHSSPTKMISDQQS